MRPQNVPKNDVLMSFFRAALVLALASPVLANPCSEATPGEAVLVVDHRTGGPTAFALALGDGEHFFVLVRHTDPGAFTYNLAAVALDSVRSRMEGLGPREEAAAVDVCLTGVHRQKFGGHIVRITRRAGAETDLPDVVIILTVSTDGFRYELAGAFTISNLIDPVYTLADGLIVRNLEAEDAARLGFGGFINVYHSSWPWVAAAFGIGLDSDGQTRYYLGPGFRFGDTASIVGGVVFGPVSRLPDNLIEGDRAMNIATVDMDTRLAARPFVAFSYSFVGWGGGALERPFQGE